MTRVKELNRLVNTIRVRISSTYMVVAKEHNTA